MRRRYVLASRLLAAFLLGLPLAATADDPGNGNSTVDKSFETGTLRLSRHLFGSGVKGGADLKRLYDQKDWKQLVHDVVEKHFVSDLYYFYLGSAAEAQGYSDTAKVYYYLAIQENAKGTTCNFGIDSCRGIPMPQTAAARLHALYDSPQDYERTFTILNLQNDPIDSAAVTMETASHSEASCTTDTHGACSLKFTAHPSENPRYRISAPDMIAMSVSIPNDDAVQSTTVRMTGALDFFCTDLRKRPDDPIVLRLRPAVLELAEYAEALGASVKEGSVCQSELKTHKYASLLLVYNATFNEIRADDYRIGVLLFDDVIRKVLHRLANELGGLRLDGYDIAIVFTRENLVTHNDLKASTYRFYLAREAVRRYEDKDITAQKLMDASIILRDGDRVDLRLQ